VLRSLPGHNATLQELCTSVFSVAATLAMASLSFYCFERHFLRLKRRFPVFAHVGVEVSPAQVLEVTH
jgi:peptidoglycan/LPS O-acetylase OafA/YrhL